MKRRILFDGVEENFERLENDERLGVGSKPFRVVQEPTVGHDHHREQEVWNEIS